MDTQNEPSGLQVEKYTCQRCKETFRSVRMVKHTGFTAPKFCQSCRFAQSARFGRSAKPKRSKKKK